MNLTTLNPIMLILIVGRRSGDWRCAVDVHAERADAEAPFQIWSRIR